MPNKPKLIGDKDRLLLREDQDRLLAWLQAQGPAWEPIWRFAVLILNSGLRVSEACRLEVQDCDLATRPYRLLVRGGKKRAADEVDEIFVSERFARMAQEWIAGRPSDVPLVARGRVHHYTRQHVWERLKQAYRACGLSAKFGVHTLRHRFITTTWLETENLIRTQRQARHRTLDQTSAYIHLASLEAEVMGDLEAVGDRAEPRGARARSSRRKRDAEALAVTQAARRRRGKR